MYKVFYTPTARADLRNLDYSIAQRISKKIFFYSNQKDPMQFAKRLSDSGIGNYRFRIGDYRAIFDIDSKQNVRILMILRIRHRKDIYKI